MRRLTQEELGFYDGLATRINNLLGDPACALTQSSLAHRIGWHRVSLCNFLNRVDKTIAAHFIPKIAQTFRLSADELTGTAAATGAAARSSWDPRADDAETLINKLGEWRDRNLANVRLHGHLPPVLLPRRGMVANYVCSVFDGGFPDAAERWHDVIDAEAQLVAERGEGDVVHVIARSDLLRFSDRQFPFQRFSTDEVVYALEMLKKNWVRHRGFALVVVEDEALSPVAKLELASSYSIVAVGREVRVEYGNDFRVRWTEDAEAVSSTNDCLLRLKKAAGLGARERPTVRQVEEVIDELLSRVDGGRLADRLPRNANSWGGSNLRRVIGHVDGKEQTTAMRPHAGLPIATLIQLGRSTGPASLPTACHPRTPVPSSETCHLVGRSPPGGTERVALSVRIPLVPNLTTGVRRPPYASGPATRIWLEQPLPSTGASNGLPTAPPR